MLLKPVYLNSQTSSWQKDRVHQFPTAFSSDEGYHLLGGILSEEHKLLHDIKKIVDKRVSIDEQYAKSLLDLKRSTDRVIWPTNTHPVASACRDLFEQWSQMGTFLNTNTERFKRTVVDGLLKELIEQKQDSKKHLDEEKRRYDAEHRKAQSDLADADRRYSDQAKAYVSQNNEYRKIASNIRSNDDARLKRAEENLIKKRNDLHRAHNDYTLQLFEHNFVDEQYVRNVREFLFYHEEAQYILNTQWKMLLENLAKYTVQNQDDVKPIVQNLQRITKGIDPVRCYDEVCRTHSNLPSITVHPQTFNELLIDGTGLDNVRANELVCDDSTITDIRNRIQSLKVGLDESKTQLTDAQHAIDQINDADVSYPARKKVFENAECAEYLQSRMAWEIRLKNDLEAKRDYSGFPKEGPEPNLSNMICDMGGKLEDQMYYHGILPRFEAIKQLSEKGDFLIRINDENSTVLSVLWVDPNDYTRLKDSHFKIYHNNNMYSFQTGSISKPTVKELVSYYMRGALPLRDDGTKLIRPVERPSYIINNDDVHTGEILGKGNFGQVVRGEYRGQPVAVKILHATTPNRALEDQKNFIQEALLLKQYKHKNIVKFIGVAGYKNPLMIVMELVENGSLAAYVKKTEIAPPQLIQLCYEIAKGMAYLEESHVIHRDLAARNCLVDKNGMAKVADFGLSRCLQDDEEYFSQTKEVPTRWWAVEVFSQLPYTHKSDVWSYGITAWEIFSRAEIPYWHLQANYLVIDAIKRGDRLKKPDKCPDIVFKTISNCWLHNPEARPTFKQLVEILQKEKPRKWPRAIPFFTPN